MAGERVHGSEPPVGAPPGPPAPPVPLGHDVENEAEVALHRLCGAEAVQRVHDEVGVAQPAVAVVPRAVRVRRFGDRRRQRGDDGAGILEHVQLQRDPLAIPFEWQDAVIRAGITLKLNVFEDTGAIIAALTTSIPEAADSNRTWDYRYCWLRDAYFVVNALNRLGATQTMERYLSFILNIVAEGDGGGGGAGGGADRRLAPVYTLTGHHLPPERLIESLPGYRGIGPVRVGNQAFEQAQHDVYGSSILAATHVFYDRRLVHQGDESLFRRLEPLGERCAKLFDQPDAGLWELRGRTQIHTFSAVMCWVGCERLGRIAGQLGLADRAAYWCDRARAMHEVIAAPACCS